MKALIIAGTDTDVGKTVVAAMLTLALGGHYWKPIQAGTKGSTDRQTVAALTGLPEAHFSPERYVLSAPLSPHRAAELDGVRIDLDALTPPAVPPSQRLIVEGAGGLLVPLNRECLQMELFQRWGAPVVLVARTRLGTINHTLLSLEALHARAMPVLGVLFVGEAMEDSERTIAAFGHVKRLGRLPFLERLNAASLAQAFREHFALSDFEALP